MVTTNLNESLMVGQIGNTLTCDVSGADNLNPTITYQWSRNNGEIRDSNARTLNLSPLRLSSAGDYTCNCTVSSILLNDPVSAGNTQRVMIQSELINLSDDIIITHSLFQQSQIHNLLL